MDIILYCKILYLLELLLDFSPSTHFEWLHRMFYKTDEDDEEGEEKAREEASKPPPPELRVFREYTEEDQVDMMPGYC